MSLMQGARPDFIVVGAMKSGTTTLHEQLARQPGIAMSRPKEPNFFSDDPVYARGIGWYESLFRTDATAIVRGESSTHYAKLPTYPRTVERMVRALPDLKIVYLMRHPIERLVSHYWHERLERGILTSIDQAVDCNPELIDYGRFAMQIEPYLDAYGPERVFPLFLERVAIEPQGELDRLCSFLGLEASPFWDPALKPQNVGTERMRRSEFRHAVVNAPVLAPIRRKLVPKSVSDWAKGFWRVKRERPRISHEVENRLVETFDEDLARLGSWLGVELDCATFEAYATRAIPQWSGLLTDANREAPETPVSRRRTSPHRENTGRG
jgi:hypothetical protein